jgi:hypothetical protein
MEEQAAYGAPPVVSNDNPHFDEIRICAQRVLLLRPIGSKRRVDLLGARTPPRREST